MSGPTDRFAPRDARQLAELVAAHPLAWVVTSTPLLATPLPLRPVLDPAGVLSGLHGHFARSNPQVEALRACGRALLLFMGPHGYVSPSWMADRTQAPTWIYASLQIVADLVLQDDTAHTDASLDDLSQAMEAGRVRSWNRREMGERYARLRRGVVSFDARIVEVRAKIKAAQDEREDVRADILTELTSSGQTALEQLVRDMNP